MDFPNSLVIETHNLSKAYKEMQALDKGNDELWREIESNIKHIHRPPRHLHTQLMGLPMCCATSAALYPLRSK